MRTITTIFLSSMVLLIGHANTANAQLEPTSSADRNQGFEVRDKLTQQSYVAKLNAINIGPTIMSGRIVDLEVNPQQPQNFFAAYASGGLWVTENYGNTFEPLFDQQDVMSIGDIAVNWQDSIIWVGTGENNSSRSSYSGNGLYKSTDGGKTWIHLGLDDTQHIGRIILHPTNKDIVWVAAIGHLYSPNAERGVYKTTDGGKTWVKTLFLNDDTGAIDLIVDPKNPDVLFASMWERERNAWNFKGSGKSSGIFKSTDGGVQWTKLNNGKNGFPDDEGVGRIGLAISHQNSNKIYALLDNQNRLPAEKKSNVVTKTLLNSISITAFMNLSDGDINDFLDRHNFPDQYNATDIKKDVQADKLKPNDLVSYLADANAMLFDTPVKGAEVYVSNDGGLNWVKTHEDYIDGLYYSYGYYFGNIRVAPQDENKVYILGVPILKSEDGGNDWENINGANVHADHHALWVSATTDGLLINGNDGGVNISFDDGASWTKQNTIAVGQFYAVNVDDAKPYNVYGGLQDNGVWAGPNNYKYSEGWTARGQYPYKSLYGGDGMQVVIDTRDNNTVYTGFQFGNYARINKQTGKRKSIKPKHTLGETPLRFNWQSPIHLSIHNQDVVYFGSNKFHRSLDQGDHWDITSDDLTNGGKKGNVPYGTLSTLDESPIQFGLLYAGSDDGLVHISKDGGNTWENISSGLEPDQWVSRVEASHHQLERVYVALNGYRWDRFDAMVYVSEDFGKSWTKIGNDLPSEPVNVIREDPVNENLLYVGTDHGVYVSLDRGGSFMLMDESLPKVAVHDMVIQERAHDLVIGTHGRSIYRADIEQLQQLTNQVLNQAIHIFDFDDLTYSEQWGEIRWSKWYGYYEPELTIPAFVKNGGKGSLKVYSNKGTLLREQAVEFNKGLNYIEYDLTMDEIILAVYKKALRKSKTKYGKQLDKKANGKYYLIPGTYTIKLTVNGITSSSNLKIKPAKERSGRKPQKKIP